jgi:hypothetical protein
MSDENLHQGENQARFRSFTSGSGDSPETGSGLDVQVDQSQPFTFNYERVETDQGVYESTEISTVSQSGSSSGFLWGWVSNLLPGLEDFFPSG